MEMLGSERAETVTALGKLSHAGLVSHHRPEGEPIHWFATPEGKAQAEQLHRAVSGRLAADGQELDGAAAPAATPAPPDSPDHQRVRTRRRVAIDQNEKTGFSWD
jgi:DNA-binding MarR family transcriptional regulator